MSKELIAIKAEEVERIIDRVKRAKSIVMVEYRGLTVLQDTQLRNELRKANVEYKVLKNRLVLRALNMTGHPGFDKILEGPTGVAFSYDDVVAPAKIMVENANKIPKLNVKGGLIEGKLMLTPEINVVATIPAKPMLVAQLLGMLTSPMRSLAVALDQIAAKNA